MKYKLAIRNFDVVPDHATMAHLGKFVAFVRVEHDKFRKGQESLIALEEIKQLDLVNFEWKDVGIRKLRKRKRAPIDDVATTSTSTRSSREATQKKTL